MDMGTVLGYVVLSVIALLLLVRDMLVNDKLAAEVRRSRRREAEAARDAEWQKAKQKKELSAMQEEMAALEKRMAEAKMRSECSRDADIDWLRRKLEAREAEHREEIRVMREGYEAEAEALRRSLKIAQRAAETRRGVELRCQESAGTNSSR
jgi:hypothetical protein